MTRINLNERIKVRLTDLGKDIYYHQFDYINERAGRCVCKPEYPKTDKDGYTEFQLWVFIELYGKHIGMAKPNVIYPNEMVCIEEPTTDATPVVRCKYCKHYEIAELKKDGTDDRRFKPSVCMKSYYAEPRDELWFCADGERREDGKVY